MRNLATHLVVPLIAVAPACLPHGQRHDYEAFARSGGVPMSGRPGADRDVTADEASLAKEARLEPILRIALAKNPDLLEEEERVRERLDRVPPSARLPDLELKYEQWGVPLGRPYALDEADTLMLGIRQTFPAPGVLDARESAAVAEAEIARYTLRARQLDVIKQVEHAYYEDVLSDREYRIHLEHVELTERALDLTRSNFRAGSATEQDVLRVGVELQSLHRDIAKIEQRKRSATALLNALMGRDTAAPLGPAPDLQPTAVALGLVALEQLAEEKRPEVLAAVHRVRGSQAGVDAADRTATWPSFMVGVDYWLMPNLDEPHAYGAMVSINLPWLNPKHREEVKAAERATSADRRALAAVKITVRYEVDDAFARYEAARETYLITKDDLLPVAQQSFEAAQAGFAAGKGNGLALLDALQSLLQVRLDEVRELVALKAAIADLARAVGTDLAETPITGAQP